MARLAHLYAEDFCCIEKMSIPLSNRGLVLIMGDNQDTDAADNNGAGKSTPFKAITWCLFGETLDGDKYDEVIRWGQKQAEVALSFYVGEEMWIVRRWRTKGSPGLSLGFVEVRKRGRSKDIEEKDWEGSSKEIQAKIIDLLGMDFRALCNTTLFGEGDRARFFSATDTAKKETLHRILRSDIYRRAEKHLKEHEVKALKLEVDTLAGAVTTIKARIEEQNVDWVEGMLNEWEDKQDGKIQEALEEVRKNTAEAKTVEGETQRTRKTLEAVLKEAQETQREFEKLEQEAEEAATETDKAREKVRDLQQRVREIDLRTEDLDEKLAQLGQDNCPTCTAPLKKGVPATYRKKLLEERTRLIAQATPMREQIRDAITEQSDWQKKATDLEHALNEAEGAGDNPADIEHQLQTLDATAAGRRELFKKTAAGALERMKALQAEVNPYEEKLDATRQRFAELEEQLADHEEKLVAKRTELAHYEFWVKGFGSQGLPSLLLDSTMPYISSRANEYLETLTDGDITLMYSTQRELKGGGKKDEIEATVTVEGVPGATPSKGQKRKLDLSSDLALVDLAESRAGDLGLLMMDEVLDGLDAEGVARVLRLLHELRTKRSSIFVVTHEPGLAEAFERGLLITKKDKAATITEVK